MSPATVPPQVMLNGRLHPSGHPGLPSFHDGSPAGDGVFETIKVLDGHPVFFGEHCARLAHGVAVLGLGRAPDPAELRARCYQLLAANAITAGVLQVTVFAAPPGAGELISAGASRYRPVDFVRGFRLKAVRDARGDNPFARLKTIGQRVVYQQARRAAQAAGADEAILVDPAGIVLEGAVSNIFMVRRGRLVTPPLTANILPGIVRARLLLAPELPPVEETIIRESDFGQATEVFVTNSLLGVMPVARVEGTDYDLGLNPVTRAAIAACQALEAADLARSIHGRGR